MKRNTALTIMIVNFGITLSKKDLKGITLSKKREVKSLSTCRHVPPPPESFELNLVWNFLPMGLHTIWNLPLILYLSPATSHPLWYVINVHILATLYTLPLWIYYITIVSSLIYIEKLKKLNYCDFIVAPAPKWFLVISHHFSCSAKVISWKSKCFLLYSLSSKLIFNLNLRPCQTLMWSVILSISSYVTYGIRHISSDIRHMTWRTFVVTNFLYICLNLSTYVSKVQCCLKCAV